MLVYTEVHTVPRVGLVSGPKALQCPLKEGVALLNSIQDEA